MASMWADSAPASPPETPLSPATVPETSSFHPPPRTPHPYLAAPKLFVGGITEAVPDAVVVEALSECLRLRPVISRESGSSYADATGYIEFETLEKAEKAYATANPAHFPEHGCSLTLHIGDPSGPADRDPTAAPRLFKHLPLSTTPGSLFELCRPFGPIYRVTLQLEPTYPVGEGPPVFKGQAVVAFYDEPSAQFATEQLHCAEVEGDTIVVQVFEPARAAKGRTSRADSPAFVPSGTPASPAVPLLAHAIISQRPRQFPHQNRSFSGTSQTSIHGGGSSYAEGSTPRGGPAIDPCNLFIKNLDASITSQDLHNLFAPYGTVVSARVMRDERTHVSKEFGFVAFQHPFQAQAALAEMDGATLVGTGGRGRAVVVRVHEPRKLREERRSSQQYGSRALEDAMAQLSTGTYSPDRSLPSSPLMSRSASGTCHQADLPDSPEPPASEHDRLTAAVQKLQPARADEIVALLEGLPKRERALCLFNPGHLKLKVSDALLVLSAESDWDTDVPSSTGAASLPTPASTPKTHKRPGGTAPGSLAALGQLPAKDIVDLIDADVLGGLGVEKVQRETREATQAFMEGLEGKPVHEVKQKLGDRLFKVVKSTGVKGAPRITIQLLDSEELVALAHLIDYPVVLKEKVLACK